MVMYNLHSMFNDMETRTISVHIFNDFDDTGCLFEGLWKDMPINFHDCLVRCFGIEDNGEIYVELEPGEEDL